MQQQFATQQRRVVEIQTILDETHEQIKVQMIASPAETADPVISQQRFRYIQHLKMQAQHLSTALRQEQNTLERIRDAMRQAHVKKKSLDKLEEKQREDYRKKLDKLEEIELEDLIIARGKRF